MKRRSCRPTPAHDMASLESMIARAMLEDQPKLRERFRRLARSRRSPRAREHAAGRLQAAVARSLERRRQRERALPAPDLAPDLPISAMGLEISAAIRAHPVVVVCGETGSGKTTQLPKICMRIGLGAAGLIGHTLPRRVAARSVATRVAREMGSELGRAVGYQVRFGARVGSDCHLKIMTDGILLAEIHADPELRRYDTLIIDEAHERTLNIDFLLGYLKDLLERRDDLKLIVSSATMDATRMSGFFRDAPVLDVSGRTFPIEVRYRPPADDSSDALLNAVTETVVGLGSEGAGDVLVFLAGEEEIRDTAAALRRRISRHPAWPEIEILPLYARLPLARQLRIFEPSRGRRVVLATNIAETSLTVPGVRYVVDTGRARISRYSHRHRVQTLPIEPISIASAEQRKGRCGRLGPGVCIRLFSREDLESRPSHPEPEIMRANLAAVLLRIRALGIADLTTFPFLDPPDPRYVSDGERLLGELGAMDELGGLTAVGRRLARLPIDPRIGRMLLEAGDLECVREVLVVASGLTVADPRDRSGNRIAATRAHARFTDPRSDFMTLVNLWNYVEPRMWRLASPRTTSVLSQAPLVPISPARVARCACSAPLPRPRVQPPLANAVGHLRPHSPRVAVRTVAPRGFAHRGVRVHRAQADRISDLPGLWAASQPAEVDSGGGYHRDPPALCASCRRDSPRVDRGGGG